MNISIPGADYTPQLTGYTGQGAFRFWCQKVLPIVYDDSLSYYELLNKMVIYLNNTISDVATAEDNIGKLLTSYNSLQDYVNASVKTVVTNFNELHDYVYNYFSELDVSGELENIVDNMVSDGSFSAIILRAIADNMPFLTPEMFGAVGDGVTDDTLAVQSCINASGNNGYVKFNQGAIYLIKSTITANYSNLIIDGGGANIIWEPDNPSRLLIFDISGSVETPLNIKFKPVVRPYNYDGDGKISYVSIVVSVDPSLEIGDRIILQSARSVCDPSSDPYWCGTPTGTVLCGDPADWPRWCDYLSVKEVIQNGNEWTIVCDGSLSWPYYYAEPIKNEDLACILKPVYESADSTTLLGYYAERDALKVCLDSSVVYKTNFVTNTVLKNLNITANAEYVNTLSNTVRMNCCDNCYIENVNMKMKKRGRALVFDECINCHYANCSVNYDIPNYLSSETLTHCNCYTFASCVDCSAINCFSENAGQSFDVNYIREKFTYALMSRNITIDKCRSVNSTNSGMTTHSGCCFINVVNSEFVNCSRPVCIRSPYTTVKNCTFIGSSFPENGDQNVWGIEIGEPTIFGCNVEGNIFSTGVGIVVTPYLIRAFNWRAGNYFIKESYDATTNRVIPSNPDAKPIPPDNANIGLKINDNTFINTMGVLLRRPANWLVNSLGVATDYSKQLGNILICGNRFVGEMQGYGCYFDHCFNNVYLNNNTFEGCKKSVKASATRTELIHFATYGNNCCVEGNKFFDCVGWINLVRPRYNSEFMSDSKAIFTCLFNEMYGENSNLINLAIQPVNLRHQNIYGLTNGDSSISVGLSSKFDGGVINVNETETNILREKDVFPSIPNNTIVGVNSLIRTWIAGTQSPVQCAIRIAVFGYDVSDADYARICACWDNGTDEQGNNVTFSSNVVLMNSGTPITFAPPLNARLTTLRLANDWTTFGEDVNLNSSTGVFTIDYDYRAKDIAFFFNIYDDLAYPANVVVKYDVLNRTYGLLLRLNSYASSNAQSPMYYNGNIYRTIAPSPSKVFGSNAIDKKLDGYTIGTDSNRYNINAVNINSYGVLSRDVKCNTLMLGSTSLTEQELVNLKALLN